MQFGIYGMPRGDTKPNLLGKVSVGVAIDPFRYGSFQFMSEKEFSKLGLGKPTYDVKTTGEFIFWKSWSENFRKEPFCIP